MYNWRRVIRRVLAILIVCTMLIPARGTVFAEENKVQAETEQTEEKETAKPREAVEEPQKEAAADTAGTTAEVSAKEEPAEENPTEDVQAQTVEPEAEEPAIAVQSADGVEPLAEADVAEIIGSDNTVKGSYSSLKDAFDDVQTGDTVKLLSDITLTEQVDIEKALNGLTLDGNHKTITCETTTDPSKSGGSALCFGDPGKQLYCTGIRIKDLTMKGTARFAIFLSGGTTSELTNVNISGSYLYAINLYGTHGATMTDCKISNDYKGTTKQDNEDGAAIWSNVASANPLKLIHTDAGIIGINKYTAANTIAPKIIVDENSRAEIHTYDDGSVSHSVRTCVDEKNSTGSYVIKTYNAEADEWQEAKEFYEVRTSYDEGNQGRYNTLKEAIAHTDPENQKAWIAVIKDCTLDEDVTLPDGVGLDVQDGVTFTIDKGVTLTVAAKCKRLGIQNGATVVNHGTILAEGRGSENSESYVMVNGTFDISTLAFPEGYGMCKNYSSYYGVKISDAAFEVEYVDHSRMYFTENAYSLETKNAEKITLLKDVAKSLTFNSKLTIDLNGKKWINKANQWTGKAATALTMGTGADVTIKNGTVQNVVEGSKECLWLSGGAKVTLESDVILDGGDGYGIYLDGGTLEIKGNSKVISNGNYAIAGNGDKNIGSSETTVTISDNAEISAPNGTAIYHPHVGVLNITGGTITGKQGIEMCGGVLNISGSPRITATGNYSVDDRDNVVQNGMAISLLSRGGNYQGTPSMKVEEGSTAIIISEKKIEKEQSEKEQIPAVAAYKWDDSVDKSSWDQVKDTWADADVQIAGGWYSTRVNQNWCVKGYIATNDLTKSSISGITVPDTAAPYTVMKPNASVTGTISSDSNSMSDSKADMDKTIEAAQNEAEQIASKDKDGNVTSIKVEVKTDGLTRSEVPAEDAKKLDAQVKSKDGESVALYVDVSVFLTRQVLTASGDIVENPPVKLTSTSTQIPITLEVAGIGNKFVRVLHVHDGVTEELPCTVDRANETVTVLMNKFSTLAVVTSGKVTVTFDSKGGSAVNPVETTYNSTIARPADPTRSGYTFKGWYTDTDCKNAFDFSTKLTQEKLTLYAKWDKNDEKKSDGKSGSSSTAVVTSAKTGDSADIWLPVILILAAGCGIAGCLVYTKKRELRK